MISPTYLISTHVDFGKPLIRLLASLKLAGVTKWEVHPGNSFDYTAIISALEKEMKMSSHVVLLHDTMEVSPETPALVETADPESGAVAAFGGQCNLGLFRTDYLHSIRKEILAMKDCSKKQAIAFEGWMWRNCPNRTSFANSECIGGMVAALRRSALRLREFYTRNSVWLSGKS